MIILRAVKKLLSGGHSVLEASGRSENKSHPETERWSSCESSFFGEYSGQKAAVHQYLFSEYALGGNSRSLDIPSRNSKRRVPDRCVHARNESALSVFCI